MKRFEPGKIEIFITIPEINGLTVSGSVDVIAENEIEIEGLDLAISGSGDISLKRLNAEKVKAAISWSGNIIIDRGGVANNFTVSVSGSGDARAGGFEARDVVVKIAGSGDCTVYSTGSLKAVIAGSGSVYYKGNSSVNSSVAGSGKVKKL